MLLGDLKWFWDTFGKNLYRLGFKYPFFFIYCHYLFNNKKKILEIYGGVLLTVLLLVLIA
jgi:hypothetical protein